MGHAPLALAIGPACAAAVKVILWAAGLAYAIHFRRLLFATASALAAGTATTRGLLDSGVHLPYWLSQSVVYWSTPIVALIVAAFVAGRYEPVRIGPRGWRF